MQEPLSTLPEPRTAKRCRDPGKLVFGLLTMLAGGLSIFYLNASTISIIIGSALLILGAVNTRAWQCSHCHAKIDRDEVQCPRCALPFSSKT